MKDLTKEFTDGAVDDSKVNVKEMISAHHDGAVYGIVAEKGTVSISDSY